MTFKQSAQKLNGKKRYIIGIPTGVIAIILFLAKLILGFNAQAAAQATQLKINTGDIEQLQQAPIEIAGIKKDIGHINEKFNTLDQRQGVMEQDIKQILQAVKR